MRINGQDVIVIGGDSEPFLFGCYDNAKQLLPLVSGDSVTFFVRERLSSPTKLFTKAITTFTNGKALINILPTDTENLTPKTYYYSIKVVRADGTTKTIIHDKKFTIE